MARQAVKKSIDTFFDFVKHFAQSFSGFFSKTFNMLAHYIDLNLSGQKFRKRSRDFVFSCLAILNSFFFCKHNDFASFPYGGEHASNNY